MFALKLTLAVAVLLFLTYNGLAIFATEKPALQKWIELTLYTIIIMIISNIIISVITYYQTKDKKGIAGDKGIKGQIGDTGNRGKCDEKCGTKVCQLDLTNIANTTFYIELEKIYGGVMLQYNLNENRVDENKIINFIWKKIYDNHKINLIQKNNREKFNALDEDEKRKVIEDLLKVYATYSPDKKRLYIRIHGGQDLGNELRARITSNNEYFKYKSYIPEVVSREDTLDSINSC